MSKNNFFSKWWLHILFFILALFLFVIAIYMSIPEEKKQEVIKYFLEDPNGKKATINFLLSIAQLLIVIVFVKVFLAQRIFLEAIYEHFKTIFIDKSIVKLYNTEELTKIADSLNKIDGIDISYLKSRQDSLKLIEDEWKSRSSSKKTSFIITDYQNTDTIYTSKNFEIKHKKIFFKMMNNDNFSYQYYFIPFDKNTNYEDYKIDKKNNRWDKKSLKCIAKRINSEDEDLEIDYILSIDKENDKDWIKIDFIHKPNRYRKLKKDDEFFIEFSVSSPIDLSNNSSAIERRKEYFKTSYQKPCAIKTIKFQIEIYDNNDLTMEPIIKLNDTPVRVKPEESIYYKTWSWNFYYCDTKEQNLDISIKKD